MYHTFYSYFIVLSGIYLLNNRRGRKFAIIDLSSMPRLRYYHYKDITLLLLICIVVAHLHRWQQKRAGKLFIAAK